MGVCQIGGFMKYIIEEYGIGLIMMLMGVGVIRMMDTLLSIL